MDYAVIKTGGKQYRVSPGDVIEVEKLSATEGSEIELADVLLLSKDGNVIVGAPNVPDAKVLANVESHIRGKKIVVFKYKPKTRHGVKTGHRQSLTKIKITDLTQVSTSRIGSKRVPKKEIDSGS